MKPFVVHNTAGVCALKYWLQKDRPYNTFVETLDCNHNVLFGLLWDYEFGKFPSSNRKKRGVVVVLDETLVQRVALTILANMKINDDYGKQWAAAQRDLYKFGREAMKKTTLEDCKK